MALLTPDEAAKELNISYKQLRALTKAGLIKYVNIGCGEKYEARRYTKEDLDEFIERRKQAWRPTGSMGKRNTPTISLIGESAFQAQREKLRNARLTNSKKPKSAK